MRTETDARWNGSDLVRPAMMELRACLLRMLSLAIGAGLCLAPRPVSGQFERKVTKLADGVYEIRHRDALDGFAGGNTTVIIGDRQVFVVDACFLPSDARADIAQIRQWTNKPVSFVLNTHFHNDHNLGNRVYMDSFPDVTIIAHAETKKDMDLFGPGSLMREQRGTAAYQKMLDSGKNGDGSALSTADLAELKSILARRAEVTHEIGSLKFQSATLTFDHDFSIDLGGREVEIKFLGRGNTAGDAVVYVPKEKIAITGDLVVYPVPYIYDGYPSEWIQTMDNLARLDAGTIVPGHGPIMHDKAFIYLIHDLLQSAVAQMNEALRKSGPAMFRSVEDVKAGVDLSPFRKRFAGEDAAVAAEFDRAAANLINVVFREASLR